MACQPNQASLCAIQSAVRQVTKARATACPELEAGGARREAALEVLKQGNFTLEEFGSEGFDVFVLSELGEILADPLRPDLVSQNIEESNFSGSIPQPWLVDYITWVTKWGGGWVPHHDIRLEGEMILVATYVESCSGSGDRLAVSFNRRSITTIEDCSREANTVCARYNGNAVFGRSLIDMLLGKNQMDVTRVWYNMQTADDYRVADFSVTSGQLGWEGYPNGFTLPFPDNFGTLMGGGATAAKNGYNYSDYIEDTFTATERYENIGETAWTGSFMNEFTATHEAGFIGGVVFNNTAYFVASLLRNLPKDLMPGPLCSTCVSNASLVCAMVTAQALISHTRVSLLLPNKSIKSITYDPWFGASHSDIWEGDIIWPKGFHVVAFNKNSTCLADGHNVSNVGKNASEIFGNDQAHENFLVAAAMNARWMPYEDQGERRIGYVNTMRYQGNWNYVLVSVSQNWAPWDKYGDCSMAASEECSTWKTQVLLGAAAAEVQACTDEDCLLELVGSFESRSGLFGDDNAEDFEVHLYDSDFKCWSTMEAHGLPCPPAFTTDGIQRMEAALGSDEFISLAVTAGGQKVVAFIHAFEWQAVDSASKQVFYLVSYTARDTVGPKCSGSSDCPEFSTCSSASGRCECDSDYVANMSLVSGQCEGMEPTTMNCVYVGGQDCTSWSSDGELDLTNCRDCRAGHFCVNGVDTVCPIGQYCPSGSSSTLPCPAGTAGNDTELAECYPCEPGTASNRVGGRNCLACANGTFAGSWGSTACGLCSTGHYSSSGQTMCTQCPGTTKTSGPGATSISECRHCPNGYYFEDSSCLRCPVGYDSTNSDDTSCELMTSVQVGIPIGVAVILFCCWLYCFLKKQFKSRLAALQQKADQTAEGALREARECKEEFGLPMALMSACLFLGLTQDQVESLHEGNRNSNRLIFIDSLSRYEELKQGGHKIVIISFPSIAASNPAPSEQQLSACKVALNEVLAKEGWDPMTVLVWTPCLSVPLQANPGMWKMASNSVYLYCKCADILLAVCPTELHQNGHEVASLKIYEKQAWERAEVLSICCSRGPASVWIIDDEGLKQAPLDLLLRMIRVFDGEMPCCQRGHWGRWSACQAWPVAVPLLALYIDNTYSSHTSRGQSLPPGLEFFQQHVLPHKDHIFPQHFRYAHQPTAASKTTVEVRELFGDLLHRADHQYHHLLSKIGTEGERKISTLLNDPLEDEAVITNI